MWERDLTDVAQLTLIMDACFRATTAAASKVTPDIILELLAVHKRQVGNASLV